jgi:hypothetical protein
MKHVKILLVGLLLAGLVSYQSPYDSAAPAPRTVAEIVDSTMHTDSVIKVAVKTTAETIAPKDTTVGPVKLRTWILNAVETLLLILPGIQLILKRIPTANSIKIQGWVGAVLDFLTFFQPDKSTQIKPSAPPPVQNGVEKPSLKDLQNH